MPHRLLRPPQRVWTLCGEGACADALARMFDVIAFVKSSFFFFYYKISVPSDIGLLLLIF